MMVSVETIVISSSSRIANNNNDPSSALSNATTRIATVQRSFSMPDNTTTTTSTTTLRPSHSEDLLPPKHRIDKYGFIVNLDKHGNWIPSSQGEEEEDDGDNGKNEHQQQQQEEEERYQHQQYKQQTQEEEEDTAQTKRRIQKWKIMLEKQKEELWYNTPPVNNNNNNDHHHRLRRRHRSSNSDLIKRRLRKGVPNEIRAQVWTRLCHVHKYIQEHPAGTYRRLVETAVHTGIQPIVEGSNNNNNINTTTATIQQQQQQQQQHRNSNNNKKSSSSSQQQREAIIQIATTLNHTKSFRNVQETIERDIHRTFPRHTLFFSRDEEEQEQDDTHENNEQKHTADKNQYYNHHPNNPDEQQLQEEQEEDENHFLEQTAMSFCGSLPSNKQEIEDNNQKNHADTNNKNNNTQEKYYYRMQSGNTNADDAPSPKIMLQSESGQAKLRRLLKAYSAYDHQIGYCQGMNFIAGMFLTIVQEEEQAFWMLVSVMNDPPCQMRSLFEEGMTGTHKVLYVAERLIHHFLPRLAKHFDKEGIHVTMFATQWLLTIFTSSFRFDLVTRVWDCFLYEGWKITYRVMLALLQHSQNMLLTMSFEEILSFFRELPEKVEAGNEIVDESIKIPLLTSHIQKYEKEWQSKQQEQQI